MEKENYFVITTNKEVATQLENFARSPVCSNGRSFTIGEIIHHKSVSGGPGFTTIQIIADSPKGIDPSDLFWLGHVASTCDKDKVSERPRVKPLKNIP